MSRTRLRVISGSAGGLLLKTPRDHDMRPTQDRIRQVVFSSLGDRVLGARVLDLYAGTGAYGIEALSRGAVSAHFVEQDNRAVQCLRDNLAHCRLAGEVHLEPVEKFLQKKRDCKYDLIFSDPPYHQSCELLALNEILPHLEAIIAPTGLLIWEYYSEQSVPFLSSWEITRHRAYGETALLFLKLNSA